MLTALTTLADAYNYTYTAPDAITTSSDPTVSAAAYGFMLLVWFVVTLPVAILQIVGMWKALRKANRPGWASLIPVYDFLQVLWMTGRPWWWILLLLIPFVNIVVIVMVYHDLSKSFGRGVGTTLLFLFLPFIAYMIIGLGKAEYKGPVYKQPVATGTPPAAPDAGAAPKPPVAPAV